MAYEAEVKAVLRAYQKALDALQRLDREKFHSSFAGDVSDEEAI